MTALTDERSSELDAIPHLEHFQVGLCKVFCELLGPQDFDELGARSTRLWS